MPSIMSSDFATNGYEVIENFVDSDTIAELKNEMYRLVSQFDLDEHYRQNGNPSVFTAGSDQKSDKYFLESGDKIRYFLENDALGLKGELIVPKERSLNKIGHALHWWNPIFRRFTFQNKFKELARSLGLKEPLVVQSMIIFKNPKIGGKVVEHQDATYLHTLPEPKGRVVGFWIPLADATPDNGCLEFAPGSHLTQPLSTRWIRTADPETGAIRMQHTDPNARYELDFMPVPAKAGKLFFSIDL